MANEEKNPKKSGFSGIFSGLKKIVYNDEYLQKTLEDQPNEEPVETETAPLAQAATPVVDAKPAVVTVPPAGSDVDGMIKKIYSAFEEMNQPGIDFLEIWNAAETMGGITEQTLVQAYKILNIGSGNSLTVDGIIASGNFYIDGLKHQIEDGIKQKKSDRQKLVEQQQTERQSLTTETGDLIKQIDELKKQLLQKQQTLAQLDSKYTTPIAVIDQKITIGNAALGQVLSQLQGAVDILTNVNHSKFTS